MLAVCLLALEQVIPHPHPLVVSASFLRPGHPGPADVLTELVHDGNRTAVAQAKLCQDGKETVRATATFGDLAATPGRTLVLKEPPDLPPPESAKDLAAAGTLPGVTIADRVEYRAPELPGWIQGRPTGKPHAEFWMRFKTGREPDCRALAMLVDAVAPVVLELGERSSRIVRLTVHVRGIPAAGWLACRASTRHVAGRLHEENFEIWDSTGTLVAEGRQLALLARTHEAPMNSLGLPPILLVHGTFARASLLAPLVDYFAAAGFDCHAPSLPGRDPSDPDVLRRTRMRDYLETLLAAHAEMPRPPIVIGHSMGGLLGQQLAATVPCTALVCLASAPPGVLWAQPRAVPHLARLLPAIMLGRPLLPSDATLRAIVFQDLPEAEQQALISRLVPDSGRAFRSLILGSNRIPAAAVKCPVLCISGGDDRNVSGRTSRTIAARYQAEHHVFPNRGHWLIAESAVADIGPTVLTWLRKITGHNTRRRHDPAWDPTPD